MDSSIADVIDIYGRYFEIVPANTAELRERAYRLRYQVYCVEHAFLDPAANPGERETDAFDAHSVHSLLIHRASGAACGTVRLILPDPAHPKASFPVYGLGPAAAAMKRRLPRLRTAELSRFAVTKEFRRRAGETVYADVGEAGARPASLPERRALPHITFGLMRAVLLMSLEHNISHLCAVMEPALLRLMARFGLRFEPAGELVDYHGLRQPCFAALEDLVAGIRTAREDMWMAGTEGGRLIPASSRLRQAG
ncbi:MAG TPA: PEP-CTERM/exosortase system-associated acyltransferase [Stellaceae bacterium]|nr:PEP-CTERM/exosortase system-associated acyltransferase [Stellaceae bacterium]